MMDDFGANKEELFKDRSQFIIGFFKGKSLIENSTTYVNVATNLSSSGDRTVNVGKEVQLLVTSASHSTVHEKIWHLDRCKKWNAGLNQSPDCASCGEQSKKAKVHKSVQLDMVFEAKAGEGGVCGPVAFSYDISQKK